MFAIAPIPAARAAVCGDANGDGSVTVTDGVLVLRAAVGLATSCTLLTCDVDGHGGTTVTDGVHILRAAAGLSNACDDRSPSVALADIHVGDAVVQGTTANVDPTNALIVGWAKTDRYYVQPSLDVPATAIRPDGTWSYETHPWQQIVVLLVDRSYAVPTVSSIDYHPKGDPGVLAYAEFPASATVGFAGETWDVKVSDPFPTGPGPCVFAADNVTVDSAGDLHLAIAERAGLWTCAEIVHPRSLGFGAYVFQVATTPTTLPMPTVFSGFIFESLMREIDIEFSRALATPHDAQFVVQPFDTSGNRVRFDMDSGEHTSHRILWLPDRIEFVSWIGWTEFPPPAESVIATFTYSGPYVPPAGGERMRFNLWLFEGLSPANGYGAEVAVHWFSHVPLIEKEVRRE